MYVGLKDKSKKIRFRTKNQPYLKILNSETSYKTSQDHSMLLSH